MKVTAGEGKVVNWIDQKYVEIRSVRNVKGVKDFSEIRQTSIFRNNNQS